MCWKKYYLGAYVIWIWFLYLHYTLIVKNHTCKKLITDSGKNNPLVFTIILQPRGNCSTLLFYISTFLYIFVKHERLYIFYHFLVFFKFANIYWTFSRNILSFSKKRDLGKDIMYYKLPKSHWVENKWLVPILLPLKPSPSWLHL